MMSVQIIKARRAILAAVCVLVAGYAGAAVAQELRAPDVFVTASRVAQELQDVPMSVSVVDFREVTRSGARTIGEVLQDVPGVQILDSGGQGLKRVTIRGEDPKRVLILIDGQKITENKSMDGAAILIDPSRIERVEVIKGPASVLYGSEAIGGVVNIITKKGGDRPVQAEIGAAYNGASNGLSENASLFGRIDGWNYRVSGAYSDQGKLRSLDGPINHTGFRQSDFGAFLSYDFEKVTIGGGYDNFDSSIQAGSQGAGYDNFFVKIPKWERNKGYVFAQVNDIAPWMPRLRLDVFAQRNEKEMHNSVNTDVTVTGMPLVIDNWADNTNDQIGASLQADWMIGDNHYLITGYEFAYDKLDATTRGVGSTSAARLAAMGVPPMGQIAMLRALPYETIGWNEGTMKTHALFAHMESTLPWDFTLNYGVRYTWVRSEMERADGWRTNYLGTNPNAIGLVGSVSNSRPVFNVGLSWAGVQDLTLRLTFAQGFRVPSLADKYVRSSMGGSTIEPNPGLKPETSNTYEFGARYNPGRFSLDGSVYFSDTDDYIGFEILDASANSIRRYTNVSSAQTYGAELMASYDFDSGLNPYVSAAYMRRTYDYGFFNNQLLADKTSQTGDPMLTGRAGLRFERQFDEKVNFFADLYGRFGSTRKQLTYETIVQGMNSTSRPRVINLGGWGTANASFGFDFGAQRQYTVMMEVLNLFDKRYNVSESILEPGLHANVHLSMRF